MFATSKRNHEPHRTPRPFDRQRDGLVVGEGAGTLVLEELDHARARGARIYAEGAGFGTNGDGTHITNPDVRGMQTVMELALKDAGLTAGAGRDLKAHWADPESRESPPRPAPHLDFAGRPPPSPPNTHPQHPPRPAPAPAPSEKLTQ